MERQRQSDECRVDEAVEGLVPAEHRQPTARVEVATEQRVQELVRRDPRCRHAVGGDEAEGGGEADETGEDDSRAKRPARHAGSFNRTAACVRPQHGLRSVRLDPLTRSREAGKERKCSSMPSRRRGTVLLDDEALERTLARIAHEIIERNDGARGGRARRHPHAGRPALAAPAPADRGARGGRGRRSARIDITFHRDDVAVRAGRPPAHAQPVVRDTRLDFDLEGRTVILVDDVLYTGRTIRAAIEALFDYGRPARVQLAVLADRGHRELPIRPDYVGKNLPTARGERVQVQLLEVDEVDRVLLVAGPEEGSE